MAPRGWTVIGAAGGALACALALAAPGLTGSHVGWLDIVIHVAVAAAFIGSGVAASLRRPDNRTGLLMMSVGLLWLVPDLAFVPNNLAWTVAQLYATLYQPVLGYLALAFPTGRLQGRGDRCVIVVAVAWTLVNNPVQLLFGDFNDCACTRRNLLLIHPDPALFHALNVMTDVVSPLVIVLVGAFIVRRWKNASITGRRVMAPALWAVPPSVGYLIAREIGAAVNLTGATARFVFDILPAVLTTLPIGMLVGVLRTRLSYAGMARLARELLSSLAAGDVQRALAQALHDPSLRVYYWSEAVNSYVDADGVAAEPETSPDRLVRPISGEGQFQALVVTDLAVSEESELLDAAVASARLALENESLHAEVLAQLSQLRAAAARILSAGEHERRRIERDLHDGAQQRLLAVSLKLASARQDMNDPRDAATRELLADVGVQLNEAVTELRELARGIHPVLLVHEGLASALQALAERAAVAVEVTCTERRFAEPIEATAYFIVGEALANVMRHAQATQVRVDVHIQDGHLVISVDDDGVGGAAPDLGSGLRGLADRLAAMDGRLSVTSPRGGGTTLIATLPCG